MKGKKESKSKNGKTAAGEAPSEFGEITSRESLRTFLLSIRDKMAEEQAAAVYAMAAMNYVMSLPDIYTLLDNENKETARDIWLRLKQSGLQLRNPVLLFGNEEPAGTNSAA